MPEIKPISNLRNNFAEVSIKLKEAELEMKAQTKTLPKEEVLDAIIALYGSDKVQ